MSNKPTTPRHRDVAHLAGSVGRTVTVAVAVAVAVALAISAFTVFSGPATSLTESTLAADPGLAGSSSTISPSPPEGSRSPGPSGAAAPGSVKPRSDSPTAQQGAQEAQESQEAQAEEKVKRRSNALAQLAERVAANAEVPEAATFRIASLNLLGSSHTSAKGNKPGYGSGAARTAGAVSLLNSQSIDVVGLQEFEADQKRAFASITNGSWQFYTGSSKGRESIAWRTSAWSYVDGGTRPIPYFRGKRLPMPWVQLESVSTGRRIFVISIHNPTSNPKRGNNARWRTLATTLELNWVRDLAAAGYPVLLTGDFNEKVTPFCRATSAGMVASNAGTASPCNPPAKSGIDWIFGTPDLTFSGHARIDGGLVNSVTDHPLIVATATYDGPVPRAG